MKFCYMIPVSHKTVTIFSYHLQLLHAISKAKQTKQRKKRKEKTKRKGSAIIIKVQ